MQTGTHTANDPSCRSTGRLMWCSWPLLHSRHTQLPPCHPCECSSFWTQQYSCSAVRHPSIRDGGVMQFGARAVGPPPPQTCNGAEGVSRPPSRACPRGRRATHTRPSCHRRSRAPSGGEPAQQENMTGCLNNPRTLVDPGGGPSKLQWQQQKQSASSAAPRMAGLRSSTLPWFARGAGRPRAVCSSFCDCWESHHQAGKHKAATQELTERATPAWRGACKHTGQPARGVSHTSHRTGRPRRHTCRSHSPWPTGCGSSAGPF